MKRRRVLFIHGAGDPRAPDGSGGLGDDLRAQLGSGYDVRAPDMPAPDEPRYDAWAGAIDAAIATLDDDALLVGHSLGASMLLKCLALRPASHRPVAGLFLVSTPFWGNDEDWKLEYALPDDFAARLPPIGRIVLYHSRGDQDVPHAHLGLYAAKLPAAMTRTIDGSEHSFTRGLPVLVDDIRATP
jgi:predicted alpha/beta hydrolase family esterase